MTDSLALDEELERRAARGSKDDIAKDLWPRYSTMRAFLGDAYYRFIQANCPWYTDHGEMHIKSVIESASRLMTKSQGGKRNEYSDLPTLDIFLTLSAILWHDVGNVVSRSGHAEQIPEMAEQINTVFPNVATRRVVEEIARAHSGIHGLRIPRIDEACPILHYTKTVYPRSLAAIVRFADEISENQTRISVPLLPNVPLESKIFWEYANCITASLPDITRERVVINFDIPAEKLSERFPCKEFPARCDDEKKISLIEYIICRIEKMNNERVYCMPYLRYGPIRTIVARFTILRGTRRVDGHDGLEVELGDSGVSADGYPKIEVFEKFFNQHHQWRPEALREAVDQ